jgi:hypothetical protein
MCSRLLDVLSFDDGDAIIVIVAFNRRAFRYLVKLKLPCGIRVGTVSSRDSRRPKTKMTLLQPIEPVTEKWYPLLLGPDHGGSGTRGLDGAQGAPFSSCEAPKYKCPPLPYFFRDRWARDIGPAVPENRAIEFSTFNRTN